MNQTLSTLPFNDAARQRWRRALAVGLIVAVLFHVAIFLIFRGDVSVPVSPFGAAGPDRGDIVAAEGGGGGMEMVNIAVAQPQPEEPTPVPEAEIVVEPVEVKVPVPAPAAPVAPAPRAQPSSGTGTAGSGGGEGADVGPGTATGTGDGGGGTGDEGRSKLQPPVPRGLIFPPTDVPKDLRGREVTVWVFVNAKGRVAPDSTRIEPATSDRGYAKRLRRTVAEWVFEPARKDGTPVGAWYPFSYQ